MAALEIWPLSGHFLGMTACAAFVLHNRLNAKNNNILPEYQQLTYEPLQ